MWLRDGVPFWAFFVDVKKPQKGHPENMSFNMRLRNGAPFPAFFGDVRSLKKGAPETYGAPLSPLQMDGPGKRKTIAKLMKSATMPHTAAETHPRFPPWPWGLSSDFSSDMLRWLRLLDTDWYDPALTRRQCHDLFERTGFQKSLLYKSI